MKTNNNKVIIYELQRKKTNKQEKQWSVSFTQKCDVDRKELQAIK